MDAKLEALLLAPLRAPYGDRAGLADDMRTMRSKMIAHRQHVSGLVTLQAHDHSDIAGLQARLDRSEKRLDPVE